MNLFFLKSKNDAKKKENFYKIKIEISLIKIDLISDKIDFAYLKLSNLKKATLTFKNFSKINNHSIDLVRITKAKKRNNVFRNILYSSRIKVYKIKILA